VALGSVLTGVVCTAGVLIGEHFERVHVSHGSCDSKEFQILNNLLK